MITPGSEVAVAIEKPAAGGRMIARHEGQILLISGAIPGERVTVRIERVEQRVAFGATIAVLDESPDRRAAVDPLCGGCLYAHIAYPRQVQLKAGIIADAFSRIGRIPLQWPVSVAPSPEAGYRMRARLHVTADMAGFYREGSHAICDPAATHQLSDAALDATTKVLTALGDAREAVVSLEITENMAGDQRAFHLDVVPAAHTIQGALSGAIRAGGLTGCTARGRSGALVRIAEPVVADPLIDLTRGAARSGVLRRQPASFFQANRFLLPDLVETVLGSVPNHGRVLDLYAGVGLFSVTLAATGHEQITAVEGDRYSGQDLRENAGAYSDSIRTVVGRVEDHVLRSREKAQTVIVDPPRSGISREAMEAVAHHGADRIVYVSCDPPTMARDARRLLDAGYRLGTLQGFDLFPNTPHVETVAVFDR